MAKKKEKAKEISLDDLEEELEETLEEEIQEIEEFSLDEISEEEEVAEIFEEGIEEIEELEEEAPKEEIIDRRGPRNKWAKKSVRYLREFMERHFKPESLVISQEVNQAIWARGIQKPPRKLKVRATKNIDGLVVIYLSK